MNWIDWDLSFVLSLALNAQPGPRPYQYGYQLMSGLIFLRWFRNKVQFPILCVEFWWVPNSECAQALTKQHGLLGLHIPPNPSKTLDSSTTCPWMSHCLWRLFVLLKWILSCRFWSFIMPNSGICCMKLYKANRPSYFPFLAAKLRGLVGAVLTWFGFFSSSWIEKTCLCYFFIAGPCL